MAIYARDDGTALGRMPPTNSIERAARRLAKDAPNTALPAIRPESVG